MYSTLEKIRLFAIAAATTALLITYSPGIGASAQTASAPAAEATIKALQEALNKQGITVKVDGVLNDDTRAALRKFQSQHHVPVTGEPDKATLDKLGVRTSASPDSASTLAQGAQMLQAQTSPASPPSGMMMSCPMMQGQHTMMQGQMHTMMQGQMHTMMQTMMQTMQTMMQTMQTMQSQMATGQPRSNSMQPGPMTPGAR